MLTMQELKKILIIKGVLKRQGFIFADLFLSVLSLPKVQLVHINEV